MKNVLFALIMISGMLFINQTDLFSQNIPISREKKSKPTGKFPIRSIFHIRVKIYGLPLPLIINQPGS